MKKVLITGGAGFIGLHLAEELIKNNYEVHLADNFSRGVYDRNLISIIENSNAKIVDIDLMNETSVEKLDKDYNLIFHLAAVVGVQHVLNSPYRVLKDNFLLLDNLLSFGKRQLNLSRFLFTSTSEVYAGTLQQYGIRFPTPENTNLCVGNLRDKRTSYMLSKIYGEAMCFHSGLPVTIFRPHNFYGPRMGLVHVIPELMKKIKESKNGAIDVFSVDHKRTFCFILDAVKMIRLLSEHTDTVDKYFNIGNDSEEISMGDLAKKIVEIMNKNISISPVDSTPGSPKRRIPSMEKVRSYTKFRNQYRLEEGIKITLDWYEKNVFIKDGVSAL